MGSYEVITGDALSVLRTMADNTAQTCVTSPPYFGLRDYGISGQIGLEGTPEAYVRRLVEVFREVRRVLRDDGTLWLNLGDSYCASPPGKKPSWSTSGLHGAATSAKYQDTLNRSVQTTSSKTFPGCKPKDLIGIPWMVAFALRSDGWYLRSDIIWAKPNPMPESVTDRPTKAHEYIFLLSKGARYFYSPDAVREPFSEHTLKAYPNGPGGLQAKRGVPGQSAHRGMSAAMPHPGGRNKRSVWTVATRQFRGAHFATFPPDLIEPCILAGSREGDTVLDPFSGAGTTGVVAIKHGRNYVGIELNPEYAAMSERRIREALPPLFAENVA